MVNAILIDDEQLSRDALRKSLELFCPGIKIVSEAGSADEGKTQIETLNPQLVFLDIAMPVKNGFELLKSFDRINFEIIFVTAHDAYTIQAIRYSAVDYILKPFDENDLVNAVERAQRKIQDKSGHINISTFLHNVIQRLPNDQMQLCVASTKGFQIIKINDIVCCEAQNSYTIFHLFDNQQVVSSKPIGDYELLLQDACFVRIHKSWLVNMKHIKEYRKGEGGIVIMINNKELEVARRKKEHFITELKKFFKY
jgi:two-component system LytT family response regulator